MATNTTSSLFFAIAKTSTRDDMFSAERRKAKLEIAGSHPNDPATLPICLPYFFALASSCRGRAGGCNECPFFRVPISDQDIVDVFRGGIERIRLSEEQKYPVVRSVRNIFAPNHFAHDCLPRPRNSPATGRRTQAEFIESENAAGLSYFFAFSSLAAANLAASSRHGLKIGVAGHYCESNEAY